MNKIKIPNNMRNKALVISNLGEILLGIFLVLIYSAYYFFD